MGRPWDEPRRADAKDVLLMVIRLAQERRDRAFDTARASATGFGSTDAGHDMREMFAGVNTIWRDRK